MSETYAQFLGSIPELYDRHLGPVIFAPYADDIAGRVPETAPGRVLEIACGTGIVTERLRARLDSSVEFVASDLNQAMIDYARARLSAVGGIDWRQADATALPFPDASFAFAVCQFGFMFVPDKPAAFREARRVLAPGGTLLFNVWDRIERNAFARIAHGTVDGFFDHDPPMFYKIPFGMHDPDEIRRLLSDASFGEIEVRAVEKEARSVSARSFATGLVRGNPIILTIEERKMPVAAIVDAVTDALAREGGSEPFRSPMRALVVTAKAI